jgi:hypothetical protein
MVAGPSSRKDALEKLYYARYILDHHESWVAFAKDNGRIVDSSDLILVTGRDKTSNWACASFSETSKLASASLQLVVERVAQGNVGVWAHWLREGSVFSNQGPMTRLSALPIRTSCWKYELVVVHEPSEF